MTRTVKRGARTGSVDIISSKSYAHRLIILASLAKSASNIECRGTSKDIEATISCMNALGARIARTGDTIHIEPITAAHRDRTNIQPQGAKRTSRNSFPALRTGIPAARR